MQQTLMAFWLTPATAPAFGHLTSPALGQPLAEVRSPDDWSKGPVFGSILAAGIWFAAQPAALAILHPGQNMSVEVISLVVADSYRRLGLASELLGWIKDQSLMRGWVGVSLSFALSHPFAAAMRRLTSAQQGWRHSEGLRVIHFDRLGAERLVQRLEPLVLRLQRSARFSMISWGDSPTDMQRLMGERLLGLQSAASPQLYVDGLCASLDHSISTVLLIDGSPSGWLMAHCIDRSLFRVTHWWVTPEWRGKGIGLLLLCRAVREFIRADGVYDFGCFSVSPANSAMLHLCRRQIEPLAAGVRSYLRCFWRASPMF